MNEKEFYGIGKSLDISLFEYGILVSIKKDKDEHCVIYGTENNGNEFVKFNVIHISEKEANSKINESWFNKKEFFEYCGSNEEDWIKLDLANRMRDMIAWYGHENICGINYFPFDREETLVFINTYTL